jgi:hypothetical protein
MNSTLSLGNIPLEVIVLNSRITAVFENIFLEFLNKKSRKKIVVFLASVQNFRVFVHTSIQSRYVVDLYTDVSSCTAATAVKVIGSKFSDICVHI